MHFAATALLHWAEDRVRRAFIRWRQLLVSQSVRTIASSTLFMLACDSIASSRTRSFVLLFTSQRERKRHFVQFPLLRMFLAWHAASRAKRHRTPALPMTKSVALVDAALGQPLIDTAVSVVA